MKPFLLPQRSASQELYSLSLSCSAERFVQDLRQTRYVRETGSNLVWYAEGRYEAVACELWATLRAAEAARSDAMAELQSLQAICEKGAKIRATVRARLRLLEVKRYSLPTARSVITPELRNQIFFRDNGCCQKCGSSYKEGPLHVDHIVPVSLGGMTEPDNLQTLCRRCNIQKGAKWPNEAAE